MATISGYDSSSIGVLFSSLNSGRTNTSTMFGTSDLLGINYSDYATIWNGSYTKLMKAYYRNLLGGLYRENPVKSRNYEAVKSSKKWENVGNSYIIPALLLYRYSYI